LEQIVPVENDLLNLLAVREGHFSLESGHHGNLWLDLDMLFLHPDAIHPFIIALAKRLQHYNPTAICGPLVGGALLAQMIASELGIEFYYTERFVLPEHEGLYPVEYRLPKSLRPAISGKRVAIIDDVINAGSAVRGTLSTLKACGAIPCVIASLLVLGKSAPRFFAAENIPLEYIATLTSNLWEPADCPLCKAQIEITQI
jgi:orotate phosphoribosyltransferase